MLTDERNPLSGLVLACWPAAAEGDAGLAAAGLAAAACGLELQDTPVLDKLLKPENKAKLVDLLKYHVVSGTVKSTDLSDGQSAQSLLLGEKLSVKIGGGVVTSHRRNT